MQEWYLMKSPTMTSGDESDLLRDFAEDSILELLATDVADDVEIYDPDMTFIKATRALIIDKTQETKLKSLRREIAVPVGTVKAGQYVKYKERFWIITGFVDNVVTHEKGVMNLCNYKLTWVDKQGKIVQRWANITSASQYNSGETGQQYYNVKTDQLMVVIPDDDDSLLIGTGERFIIDKRCKVYEKNLKDGEQFNIDNELNVYRLTRLDAVLYDYQDSGHSQFIASEDEQRPTDGYYVVDGVGYWLCESPKHMDTPALDCEIESDLNCVYCGIEETVFTAKFYDADGGEATATPIWNIESDFKDELVIEFVENSVMISTESAQLVGKSFTLILSADGYKTTSIEVPIVWLF